MKKKDEKKEKINLLYFNKNDTKTINKKRLTGMIILSVIVIAIIVIYAVYANNEGFRKFADEKILRKEINEENLKTIEIESYDKSNIFSYYKYIAILKENTLETYNSTGKKESELKLEISKPIIASNGKYLLIAEQEAQKAYMISDNTIKWSKDLEGNISRVSINANGYTSIIVSGTAYKSVIILLDNSGNEIFRNYLSDTVAVASSISDDNKYLSYAEVNTSGTLIQSNIKIISIDKAKQKNSGDQQENQDAIIYTYKAPADSLILNIKYQNKTRLVCMYDNSIHVIKDNQDKEIAKIDTKTEKVTFASIQLDNYVTKTTEENKGLLNTNTSLRIINTNSLKESVYNFTGVTKELYSCGDKIALNLGSEIHFVDTNGWLIKKYTSKQEVREIVISNEIAGIIYRNKIEIVKF